MSHAPVTSLTPPPHRHNNPPVLICGKWSANWSHYYLLSLLLFVFVCVGVGECDVCACAYVGYFKQRSILQKKKLHEPIFWTWPFKKISLTVLWRFPSRQSCSRCDTAQLFKAKCHVGELSGCHVCFSMSVLTKRTMNTGCCRWHFRLASACLDTEPGLALRLPRSRSLW